MIQRSFRYYYLKVTRQKGTPENIALGMAIGVFCGLVVPFPQMPLALLIAAILRANKITALLGTWVSNPFTYAFIVGFYLFLGQHLTGLRVNVRPPVEAPVAASQGDGVPASHNPAVKTKGKKRGMMLPEGPGEQLLFIWHQGGRLLIVWFAASTLTALIGSFVSYHVTRVLVEQFRRKRLARQRLKRKMLERKAAEEEAIRGIHMGLDDQ